MRSSFADDDDKWGRLAVVLKLAVVWVLKYEVRVTLGKPIFMRHTCVSTTCNICI